MPTPDHRRDDRERLTPAGPRGGRVPSPGTALPAGLTAVQRAAFALQRRCGNAVASRLIARSRQAAAPDTEPATSPGQTVHDVLRSPGRPLDNAVRTEMEARLGADFATVRLHTGPAASRSAAQLDASAYTVGDNVVLGDDSTDHTTLAHELTHVLQQRRGPVTGTDNGDGLRVSDPADRFERAAEDNAHRVMSRPIPEHPVPAGEDTPVPSAPRDTHVQRYVVIEPGTARYPVAGPAGEQADFFPAQQNIGGSFVNADGELNIRYAGADSVPLRISEKLDLAIEHTGPDLEAKTFYATQDRIAKANEELRGKVEFRATGNYLELTRSRRFLRIKLPDRELTLWQVEPVVKRPAREWKGETEDRVETGLDVRLAQRCNEMATEVTNRQGLAEEGERRYFDAAADILGGLTGTSAKEYRRRLAEARAAASTDASETNVQRLTVVMSDMISTIMGFRANPDTAQRVNQLVQRFHLNEYARSPAVGDVMMIKGLAEDASSPGGLDFHFAGVVATSGRDYVTMENRARHEANNTLSGGDPQWYFAMYGTQLPAQTWYQQHGQRWGDRAAGRLTIAITLH
jgi:hypothetical protein